MNKIEKCLKAIYEKFNKPVIFFDCETTGLDTSKDDIIQLYVCRYDVNGFSDKEMFFNTNRTITPEALSKHKFDKEFLSNYPFMKDVAKELWTMFDNDAIICGYNHKRFDIPILIENLIRNGIQSAISLMKREIVDVLEVYRKLYTNELEQVFRRVTGEPMDNAHNAKDDIYATGRILEVLMETNEIKPEKLDMVDVGGFFALIDGKVAFNKGKHKGKLLKDVEHKEVISYLTWISNLDDVSIHTKLISIKLKDKLLGEKV